MHEDCCHLYSLILEKISVSMFYIRNAIYCNRFSKKEMVKIDLKEIRSLWEDIEDCWKEIYFSKSKTMEEIQNFELPEKYDNFDLEELLKELSTCAHLILSEISKLADKIYTDEFNPILSDNVLIVLLRKYRVLLEKISTKI